MIRVKWLGFTAVVLCILSGCGVADPHVPNTAGGVTAPVVPPPVAPGKELSTAEYDSLVIKTLKVDLERATGQLKRLKNTVQQNANTLNLQKGEAKGNRSQISNGTFRPRPRGRIPTTTRRDFVISQGKVDQVWTATGHTDVLLPYYIIPTPVVAVEHSRAAIATPAITGYLLSASFDALMNFGSLRMPLLIQDGKIFRIHEVSLVRADGKATLVEKLAAIREPVPEVGKPFSLFTDLRKVPAMDRVRKESLLLQISFHAISGGKESVLPQPIVPAPLTHTTILSDGNPALERVADELLSVYRNENPTNNLQQFLLQAPVGDQAMHALAALQAQGGKASEFGIAAGNIPDEAFLDFQTETVFSLFSIPEKKSHRLALFQTAPASDPTWKHLFTEKHEESIRSKVTKEPKSAEFTPKLITREFALPAISAGLDSLQQEVRQNLGISLTDSLYLGERIYFVQDEKGTNTKAYTIDWKLFPAWGTPGTTLVVRPDLSGSTTAGAGKQPYFGFGLDAVDAHEIEKTLVTAVDVREQASPRFRGYLWPEIESPSLLRSHADAFLKRFFPGKLLPEAKIRGPREAEGGMTVEGLVAEADLAALSTQDLVDFWRTQGQAVLPLQRLQIEAVIHFQYKKPKMP